MRSEALLRRHEGSHVKELRELDPRRDFLVFARRMLEALAATGSGSRWSASRDTQGGRSETDLEVEASDDRQLLHRQLLRRLAMDVTCIAFDFRVASQVLWSREAFQAVDQRLGGHVAVLT